MTNYQLLFIEKDEKVFKEYQRTIPKIDQFEGISGPFTLEIVRAQSDQEVIDFVENKNKNNFISKIIFIDMHQEDYYRTIAKIRQIDPSSLFVLLNTDELELSAQSEIGKKLSKLRGWGYLRKPFTSIELVQLVKNLMTVVIVNQKIKEDQRDWVYFIKNISKLKKIELKDLILLLEPIFRKILHYINITQGALIYKSSNNSMECLISQGIIKEQFLVDPKINACLSLILDNKPSEKVSIIELQDLTAVYCFIQNKLFLVFARSSSLLKEYKALLKFFLRSTSKILAAAHLGDHALNELFSLQSRNTHLEQMNHQLRTNAERLKKLYEISIRDVLTQLYNHIHFQNTLQNEFLRFHRYQRKRTSSTKQGLALLLIDIDDFQYYNDMNGHAEGNFALKLIARIINQRLRVTDFVARYGADKIIILLHEITPRDTFLVAECLREKVEDYPFPEEEKQPTNRLTISLGVSHMINDYQTKEEFLQTVHQKVREAKEDGKNRIRADFPIKEYLTSPMVAT